MMEIDVILLAAGTSSRMGQPKALLSWQGGTLLENACAPFANLSGEKIAVLGQNLEAQAGLVEPYGFKAIINKQAQKGQSESLRVGLAALSRESRPLFCAVVDQPLLTAHIVEQIGRTYESLVTACEFTKRASFDTKRLILCPRYGAHKGRGNPVLFGPYWRLFLATLEGDQGGRAILYGKGSEYIEFIDFAVSAGVDVDTPDDYINLYNMWGSK